jgi:hypothetical protein
MIVDSNSVVSFFSNSVGSLVPGEGNMLFIGIILFLCVAVAMLWARVRAGTAVMIGATMAVMMSFVTREFSFLFWLAILASLFVLINGLRKRITGQ